MIYIFEHPETKQIKEVYQKMSDVHEYEENGVKWNRIFSLPNATIDSFGEVDPFDSKAFVKRTAKKGMSIGDMWDESKRLSQKREAEVGKDFVKVNTENEYKRRTGKTHPLADKPKTKYVDIK